MLILKLLMQNTSFYSFLFLVFDNGEKRIYSFTTHCMICGRCRMMLVYPFGAPSVKYAICHYGMNVGVNIEIAIFLGAFFIIFLLISCLTVLLRHYMQQMDGTSTPISSSWEGSNG